jgi:hypothetical protein
MFGRWLIASWDDPLGGALWAMAVYIAIAAHHGGMWRASKYAYFNYLADAFLHGQLHLLSMPASTHDLSVYLGQYYLYWPPFPAVVLMPFVALAGPGFSDILLTIAIGGLNVALVTLLLQQACTQRIIRLTPVQRSLLVISFALGSTHLTLAPYGRVWYTAQLIGFACVALAYLAAISWSGWRAFVAAGVAIGCALLTRNHLALAGLWPAVYLLYRHWALPWRRVLGYTLGGLAPVVIAVALLGAYNALRFGSALDNGLEYHRMSAFFRVDYQRYGAFNLHYLPTNVFYQFIAYPFPWRTRSSMGGSLFLLTPIFCGALWAIVTARPRWSTLTLAATVVLVAIPILLLMGTGWHQFGPRYTLDFTVPLLLLTALGIRRWPTWLLTLLTLAAVVQYVIGAVYLGTVI